MSFDQRIKELLRVTLDNDEGSFSEPKVASETRMETSSLADEADRLAEVIEKLASSHFLSSYEAAAKASARSVDAANKGIGSDVLAHRQKHPSTDVLEALRFAKKADDSAGERLRVALIAKLKEAGVESSQAHTQQAPVAPVATGAEASVVEALNKTASGLRALAERVRQMESDYEDESEELSQLRRRDQAKSIAKVASQHGFIEEDTQDDYADALYQDRDLDLEEQFSKVASATPRIPLGGPADRPNYSGATAEDRLTSRLSRNA